MRRCEIMEGIKRVVIVIIFSMMVMSSHPLPLPLPFDANVLSVSSRVEVDQRKTRMNETCLDECIDDCLERYRCASRDYIVHCFRVCEIICSY